MRYEEIVEKVRSVYEFEADARNIFEHIAVQVDIVGEGQGTFYVEVANRQICVEPYDYKDRDGLMITDCDTIMAIANKKMTFEQALEQKRIRIEGDKEKWTILRKITFTKD